MILSRRSFLTGLLAAPIIVRAGIIMPVKPIDPRPDIARAFAVERELGTMIVHGSDAFGHQMVEFVRPNTVGKKMFRYISAIEYVGDGPVRDHPCVGVVGSFSAVNMRRS
jgi:hypothetical protein